MRRGLFITGTDTDVGKTVVAAAIMQRYRDVTRLRYWKPIQTGIEQDNDTATVRRLAACSEVEIFDDGVRLRHPVSPHLAAAWSGIEINISELAGLTAAADSGDPFWIVEGAGGVLVPIKESVMMIDLMVHLSLPVIVVARSALGTINHTLLTLEALRARKLSVAGVVMTGGKNRDNREAIEKFGSVHVLGEMPHFSPIDPPTVQGWAHDELDPLNRLMCYFLDSPQSQ
jgi:dethiobiotin synthetase